MDWRRRNRQCGESSGGGEFYVFMAAVFGFTILAQVASRVSKEVMSVLRREGMSGMVWIDDFLFAFRMREEAEIGGKRVVERLKGLGFVVNKEKCVLVPRQRMEYIGFMIDSVKEELGLSEKRVKKTREVIEEVLGRVEEDRLTARWLARAVDCVRSGEAALKHWRVVGGAMDPLRVRRPKRYWDRYVWISEEARERWRFLKGEVERNKGKRFRKGEGVKKIYTDASEKVRWGVVCVGERIGRVGGAWTGEERK